MDDADYQSISDLFGHHRLTPPTGKTLDERASLLEFFVRSLPSIPTRVGMRLAHIEDIEDLYALQSQYKDRLRRPCGACLKGGMTGTCAHSQIAARKYFYWITGTKVIPTSPLEKAP